MIQIILKARLILFGRTCPASPALQDGAKGHNIKGNYLTGKPPFRAGSFKIFNRIAFALAESFFSSALRPNRPCS